MSSESLVSVFKNYLVEYEREKERLRGTRKRMRMEHDSRSDSILVDILLRVFSITALVPADNDEVKLMQTMKDSVSALQELCVIHPVLIHFLGTLVFSFTPSMSFWNRSGIKFKKYEDDHILIMSILLEITQKSKTLYTKITRNVLRGIFFRSKKELNRADVSHSDIQVLSDIMYETEIMDNVLECLVRIKKSGLVGRFLNWEYASNAYIHSLLMCAGLEHKRDPLYYDIFVVKGEEEYVRYFLPCKNANSKLDGVLNGFTCKLVPRLDQKSTNYINLHLMILKDVEVILTDDTVHQIQTQVQNASTPVRLRDVGLGIYYSKTSGYTIRLVNSDSISEDSNIGKLRGRDKLNAFLKLLKGRKIMLVNKEESVSLSIPDALFETDDVVLNFENKLNQRIRGEKKYAIFVSVEQSELDLKIIRSDSILQKWTVSPKTDFKALFADVMKSIEAQKMFVVAYDRRSEVIHHDYDSYCKLRDTRNLFGTFGDKLYFKDKYREIHVANVSGPCFLHQNGVLVGDTSNFVNIDAKTRRDYSVEPTFYHIGTDSRSLESFMNIDISEFSDEEASVSDEPVTQQILSFDEQAYFRFLLHPSSEGGVFHMTFSDDTRFYSPLVNKSLLTDASTRFQDYLNICRSIVQSGEQDERNIFQVDHANRSIESGENVFKDAVLLFTNVLRKRQKFKYSKQKKYRNSWESETLKYPDMWIVDDELYVELEVNLSNCNYIIDKRDDPEFRKSLEGEKLWLRTREMGNIRIPFDFDLLDQLYSNLDKRGSGKTPWRKNFYFWISIDCKLDVSSINTCEISENTLVLKENADKYSIMETDVVDKKEMFMQGVKQKVKKAPVLKAAVTVYPDLKVNATDIKNVKSQMFRVSSERGRMFIAMETKDELVFSFKTSKNKKYREIHRIKTPGLNGMWDIGLLNYNSTRDDIIVTYCLNNELYLENLVMAEEIKSLESSSSVQNELKDIYDFYKIHVKKKATNKEDYLSDSLQKLTLEKDKLKTQGRMNQIVFKNIEDKIVSIQKKIAMQVVTTKELSKLPENAFDVKQVKVQNNKILLRRQNNVEVYELDDELNFFEVENILSEDNELDFFIKTIPIRGRSMRQSEPESVPDEWKPINLSDTEVISSFAKTDFPDVTSTNDTELFLRCTELWCEMTLFCIRSPLVETKKKDVLQRAAEWFKVFLDKGYDNINKKFDLNACRKMKQFVLDCKNCVMLLQGCIHEFRKVTKRDEAFLNLEQRMKSVVENVSRELIISDVLVSQLYESIYEHNMVPTAITLEDNMYREFINMTLRGEETCNRCREALTLRNSSYNGIQIQLCSDCEKFIQSQNLLLLCESGRIINDPLTFTCDGVVMRYENSDGVFKCDPCTERWKKISFLFCEKTRNKSLVCTVEGCPICTKIKKQPLELRDNDDDIVIGFIDYRNFQDCLTKSPEGWEDHITKYMDILERRNVTENVTIALMCVAFEKKILRGPTLSEDFPATPDMISTLNKRVVAFETLKHPIILKSRIQERGLLYREEKERICDRISLTLYLKSELFARFNVPGFTARMKEYTEFFSETIRCLNDVPI